MTARATFVSVLALLVGCGSASSGPAPAVAPADLGPAPGPEAGRLPRDVTPVRYELALRVVPSEAWFEGRVRIDLRLDRARDVIFLHGLDLRVHRAEVQPRGGPPVAARWEQVDGDGIAALRLPQAIGPGEATVHLGWQAPFRRDHEGLFAVTAGADAYAFTQLEPLSARSVFPCFDEPSLKATFDLSLTVRAGDRAIANTPEIGSEPGAAGERTVRFARTQPLPTYLVAFAVGPLDVVEAPPIPAEVVDRPPIPFRGVAVRGRGGELAWALGQTPSLLAHLERYFGTPYPYEKLDVIAVPGFPGAMENVGAITFNDTILLIDPERSPESQKQWFAYTMAHELAHQWVGNLVTMAWWDDLWLNEGFASFMELEIVGRWNPQWHVERERVEWVVGAMDADSLASARAVRQPIRSNHDIHNAFDWITYVKGAGVLTMFERWLGEEVFRAGLRRYLAAHAGGNATAADLTRALGEAAGRDVTGPMRSFLVQSGVPLIDAGLDCPEGGAPAVTLAQSRYLPVGSTGERDRRWEVPVCFAWGLGDRRERQCVLLDGPRATVPIEAEACPEWLLPNADAAGYYRWTMAPEQLDWLRARGLSRLSVAERMSLADNLEAAFDSARTPGAEVLRAMEPLAGDSARHVATAPMGLLAFVGDHVVEEATRPAFQHWVRGLYGPRMRRLGHQGRAGESAEVTVERSEVMWHLAMVGQDPAVRRQATGLARRYLGLGGDGALHPGAVHADLVEAVLVIAAQEGDGELFDAMDRHLNASDDGVVRRQLLAALGSFRKPELAERARAMALDHRLGAWERLRPLRAQLERRERREDAWRFLREHVETIASGLGSPALAASLPGMASSLCSEAHAAEVAQAFGGRMEALPGGPRNLAAAVETIRLCAARVEAQRPSVTAWLAR